MFEIRVNGETVYTTESQVDKAHILTSQGEAAAVGISQSVGVIDIALDIVAPGGPLRLDHLEALERQRQRDLAGDQSVGQVQHEVDPSIKNTQGEHTETAETPETTAEKNSEVSEPFSLSTSGT